MVTCPVFIRNDKCQAINMQRREGRVTNQMHAKSSGSAQKRCTGDAEVAMSDYQGRAVANQAGDEVDVGRRPEQIQASRDLPIRRGLVVIVRTCSFIFQIIRDDHRMITARLDADQADVDTRTERELND
ncbi:hypothetical protein ACRALDRAFT_213235 [Sodiomyces alcalophilus JCM 7366]|uniref:uncharacterized protein n=1 Tax=Sodiomyces alcalophilus JCM 7366 TaxID=591952 RepID=UPI0039B4B217